VAWGKCDDFQGENTMLSGLRMCIESIGHKKEDI